MKTVFTNDMCMHVWAQQTQASGRNGNNTVHFEGDTLYSYNTPIARILKGRGGVRVLLLSSYKYSNTTVQHRGRAQRAFGYDNTFSVPSLGRKAGRNWDDGFKVDHKRNRDHLLKVYNDNILHFKRMRNDPYSYDYLRERGKDAQQYAALFGLKVDLDIDKDVAEVIAFRAAREARLNTPERLAKREREREQRAERKKVREARERELALAAAEVRIEAWRNGELSYLNYHEDNGWALLRHRNNELQTSMGAQVPIEHARLAFARVLHCHKTQQPWKRNGDHIRVGLFQIDEISTEGNVRAGCHKIAWNEIERFAKEMGWL